MRGGTNHLAKKNCAGSPLATKPEPQEGARSEELGVILGQAGQEREAGKPQNCQLQSPDAAEAIGKPSGQPAAKGGYQQGRRSEHPGLRAGNAPGRDQRRNHKAEDLNVHRVQSPAADASLEHAPFLQAEIGNPAQRAAGCTQTRVDGFRNFFQGCTSGSPFGLVRGYTCGESAVNCGCPPRDWPYDRHERAAQAARVL